MRRVFILQEGGCELPKPRVFDSEKKDVQDNTPKDNGLIELKHYAKSGTMFIDGEEYAIKDGKVAVKPEHVLLAKEHINLGR